VNSNTAYLAVGALAVATPWRRCCANAVWTLWLPTLPAVTARGYAHAPRR